MLPGLPWRSDLRYHASDLTPMLRTMRALLAASACTAVLASAPALAAPPAAEETTEETTVTTAQDDKPAPAVEFLKKVELSGIVDTYFTYNFNNPATGSYTPLRNFDVKHNQFSVGLVELALNKAATSEERVGFRFDLGYGQVAQIFNSDPLDGNNLLNVQQGYVSYVAPVGSGLTLDVGKFVTPIGTEPTESKDNNNYSRAFLYALGPYYHVGARLGYTVNDKFSLGGMIVNGWNASGDNNSGKSFGVSATFKPTSKVTIIQNLLTGPEQNDNSDDFRTMSDTNLSVSLTDKVTTGLNYAYVKDTVAGEDVSWQGLALYLRGQVTDVFAIAPRFEIFNDDAGLVSGAVQKLREFTLTGEVKHSEGMLFRAEYRRDWSNIDFFAKDGAAVDNQNTFTLAFVYSFSSK